MAAREAEDESQDRPQAPMMSSNGSPSISRTSSLLSVESAFDAIEA
jgi:hypothetical protein